MHRSWLSSCTPFITEKGKYETDGPFFFLRVPFFPSVSVSHICTLSLSHAHICASIHPRSTGRFWSPFPPCMTFTVACFDWILHIINTRYDNFWKFCPELRSLWVSMKVFSEEWAKTNTRRKIKERGRRR